MNIFHFFFFILFVIAVIGLLLSSGNLFIGLTKKNRTIIRNVLPAFTAFALAFIILIILFLSAC